MGYFILAPVLLADYKSAIVTCTAADCKSAETGIGNWRRIANPPKQAGASILRRRSCGFEIRRQKKGSTYFFADLKSAETGTFSFLRRYLKRIANPK